MSDQNLPPLSRPSRRHFFGQTAAAGLALWGASARTWGQVPFDRSAVDESLKGRLFFSGDTRGEAAENTGVFAYDFESRKWPRIMPGVTPGAFCRASPDGKSFVLNDTSANQVCVSIVRPEGRIKASEFPGRGFWSRDGRQVMVTERVTQRPAKIRTWRMNSDGSDRVELPAPEDEQVHDWSPDGRWLLVSRLGKQNTRLVSKQIRRTDGTDTRPLLDGKNGVNLSPGRFSPDGRSLAFTRIDLPDKETWLCVLDVVTGSEGSILKGDAEGYPENTPCWSPDGKFLAVAMANEPESTPGPPTRLEIVDLQGNRIRQLGIPHNNPVPCDWIAR